MSCVTSILLFERTYFPLFVDFISNTGDLRNDQPTRQAIDQLTAVRSNGEHYVVKSTRRSVQLMDSRQTSSVAVMGGTIGLAERSDP